MILVFAALQAEVSACVRWAGDRREGVLDGFPVVRAGDITICQTGLGRRAERAAAAMLDRFPGTAAVLSAGTAGGLHPDLRPGDIVLCRHIHHADGRSADIDPVSGDRMLIDAVMQVGEIAKLPVRVGASVTADAPAWGPDEKAGLHSWMQHDIVEMESYWAGRAAAQKGLPFLAVRAVSDGAGHRLVEIAGLPDDGTLDLEAFQAYTREHPEAVPLLAEQAERSRAAMGNLSALMAAVLPRLPAVIAAPGEGG